MSKKNVSLRKLLRKREKVVARIEGILRYLAHDHGLGEIDLSTDLKELRERRSVLDRRIREAYIAEIPPSLSAHQAAT